MSAPSTKTGIVELVNARKPFGPPLSTLIGPIDYILGQRPHILNGPTELFGGEL